MVHVFCIIKLREIVVADGEKGEMGRRTRSHVAAMLAKLLPVLQFWVFEFGLEFST